MEQRGEGINKGSSHPESIKRSRYVGEEPFIGRGGLQCDSRVNTVTSTVQGQFHKDRDTQNWNDLLILHET